MTESTICRVIGTSISKTRSMRAAAPNQCERKNGNNPNEHGLLHLRHGGDGRANAGRSLAGRKRDRQQQDDEDQTATPAKVRAAPTTGNCRALKASCRRFG